MIIRFWFFLNYLITTVTKSRVPEVDLRSESWFSRNFFFVKTQWRSISNKQNSVLFSAHKPLTLLQSVTSTVNQVCKKLKMDEKTYKNVRHGRVLPTSVHAVKNGRRKMEDRHVQIHDLNAIFSDSQVCQ